MIRSETSLRLKRPRRKLNSPVFTRLRSSGNAVGTFRAQVLEAIERHTGAIDPNLIQLKPSKHSNYLSITITIAATGEPQLESIFSDLKEIESVKLVL